jgi:hypothetical protein
MFYDVARVYIFLARECVIAVFKHIRAANLKPQGFISLSKQTFRLFASIDAGSIVICFIPFHSDEAGCHKTIGVFVALASTSSTA